MSEPFTFGIHPAIEAGVYHLAKGVSQSALKTFGRSPLHYRWQRDNPKEATPNMIRGTLFHLCVLEPDKFATAFHAKPEDFDGRTKTGKEWAAAHVDKPCLTPDEYAAMVDSRATIMANPIARFYLEQSGLAEASVFAQHEPTGMTLKCRPDWQCSDLAEQPFIIDIKTCDDARRFEYTARDFGYHMQAAFYIDQMARTEVPDCRFIFVVVELEPPHGVRLIEFDRDTINAARDHYELLLLRLKECKDTDSWPGYSPDIEPVTLLKR